MGATNRDEIRVNDFHTAAAWVREHGGSCTSPMAVEMRMEDAWRVKTPAGGATEVALGDWLVFEHGAIYAMTDSQRALWWVAR
jgi:hypothetical protein